MHAYIRTHTHNTGTDQPDLNRTHPKTIRNSNAHSDRTLEISSIAGGMERILRLFVSFNISAATEWMDGLVGRYRVDHTDDAQTNKRTLFVKHKEYSNIILYCVQMLHRLAMRFV